MLAISNDYVGVIVSAELTESEKGNVGVIVIVRPEGSPETARWYGSFSDTVIGKGDNAGRAVGEVTAEIIGKFGCTDFSKIGEILKGQAVAFGVKHRPDKDDPNKMWAEVNFIRPPRTARPVTSSGLAGINRFKGAAIAAAKNAPKPASKPNGNQQSSAGGGYDDDFGPTDYGSGRGGDDIPF